MTADPIQAAKDRLRELVRRLDGLSHNRFVPSVIRVLGANARDELITLEVENERLRLNNNALVKHIDFEDFDPLPHPRQLTMLEEAHAALAEARREIAAWEEAAVGLRQLATDYCERYDEARRQIAERDEAIRAHLCAREALEETPVQRLRPDDERFKAVSDTLAGLRSALVASPPTGAAGTKPVTMLVDQDWLSRHVATDPDASVEAGPDVLAWLSANRNVELSFDYGNADDDGKGWCVHRVNGGVNDREWTLIGTGEMPLDALRAALASQHGGGDA